MNTQQIILNKKEVIKTSDKKVLMKFRIKKVENGLSIYIQSDIFEAFFKDNGINDRGGKWSNINPYYLNKNIKNEYKERLQNWGGMLFYSENITTLSYITAVGITQGITLTDNNVYSDDEIQKFNKMFASDVLEFYRQYIKPNEHEITIYLEQRDNNEINQ